jgi:hypothetical protein
MLELFQVHLIAEHTIKNSIMPAATLECGTAYDTFAGETRLLQCALLGEVCDFGSGFDPVHLRVREQIAHQQPLRSCSITMTPGLRRQGDPNVPAERGPRHLALVPGGEPEPVLTTRHH